MKNITLFYGNDATGFRNANLSNCTNGKKQWCSINVNLTDYNGEKIEYNFSIEDIAGNIKKSQVKRNLNVDTTFPVLNNPVTFWLQGAKDTRKKQIYLF